MIRRRLGTLALAVLALAAAAPAARAAGPDRDHDKIFDDLATRLSGDRRLPVVVTLHAPATTARLGRIERSVGRLAGPDALHIVPAFSARATPAQIRALARRADVAEIQEDATVVPFGVSAQAAFGIGRARAQIPGLDGSGEVAAVIDSGIDPAMPDLAGRIVGWEDLVNHRAAPYDDLGHGSEVADILAGSGASGAEGRGVAPGASLVGVKVIDANAQSSLSQIAEGIQWAVDNRDLYGIDAINVSIGDPTGCGSGKDLASQAIDAAVANGIVVVAAAGNAGPGSCTVKDPGAAESALTVGAMADTGAGGFSQAAFSSRGPTADGRTKPDVSAPGVDVPLAAPQGKTALGIGTSAAAPFVTGTALLMLQADTALSPAQLKAIVRRTAIDWGPPGPDNDYGAGRLDAYAALQAAGAALAVPPAAPGHVAWTGTLAQGETFERTVDVTAAAFPLAATLTGPAADGASFDLSLLDPGGQPAGTAGSPPQTGRQEDRSVAAPAPGRYTLRVTATTGGGDFALDASGALAPADTTSPALTLDNVPAATGDATPALSGAAGDSLGDFSGVVVEIRRDGDVVRRIGAQPLLGRWSADLAPPLPDGRYTVAAEQGDAAGNATHTPAQAFTVDTVAPDAPVIDSPAEGSPQRAVALAGRAEPGASVEVSEAGARRGGATADAQGHWAVGLSGVADGSHAYAVVARDAAGNASAAARRTVTVDTTPPVVTISSGPATSTRSRVAQLAFAPSEPGAIVECRLDGGAWQACDGSAMYPALAPGAHVFEAHATDAAGNAGPAARWAWTIATRGASPRRCAPGLSLGRQRLAAVRLHGLKVGLRSRPPCRVSLTVRLARTVLARRAVAAGTRSRRVVIALGGPARRRLVHRAPVTLTVVATASGASAVTRRATLR